MKLKKLCSRCGKSLKNKHLQPPVDTFPARFGRRQPKKMIGFEAETANPFPKQKLEYAAEESSVRSVSMEEANAFMEWRRKTGPTLAGAVALCIISPALLIFLAGLSDSHIGNISENMATGTGISVLLLLVAAAVVIFVSYSIHGQQYEYLEKERIETAYGVTGLVQERKKDYESTFTRGIAAGVTLCILAVIPMFAAIAFSQPDYIITATVSIP